MILITDHLKTTVASSFGKTKFGLKKTHFPNAEITARCFPTGVPLLGADIGEGPFPLILWRRRAEGTQMGLLQSMVAEGIDLPPRTVLVAEQGDGFRGHFDRRWAATPGNLHVAVLLRESLPITHAGVGFALLPQLALLDAARSIAGSENTLQIKWMNDILLNGAKIGGSLSATTTSGGNVSDAVLGMGLNMTVTPPVPPDPFVPRVGCLADACVPPSLPEVLMMILVHLHAWFGILQKQGALPLAIHHCRHSAVIGEEVCLFDDGPGLVDSDLSDRPLIARGKVEGINEQLHLRIGDDWYPRGRLAFPRDCP